MDYLGPFEHLIFSFKSKWNLLKYLQRLAVTLDNLLSEFYKFSFTLTHKTLNWTSSKAIFGAVAL